METMRFDLEDLHSVQIEMLKILDAVCEKHCLRWFLGFGSLLGAARDHKIIEWDDSIDVVMPYQDYDRLVHLPGEEFTEGLFLQTYETDPEFPRYYAKLRNSNTTLIKNEFRAYDINHGIYINIFPLIRMADDPAQRSRQIKDAKMYKIFTENGPLPRTEKALWFRSFLLLKTTTAGQRIEKRDKMKTRILQYENQDTQCCFALAGTQSLNLPLDCSWFASADKCEFEGMQANIPAGWDQWLTLRYGNYMEVPNSDLQGNKVSDFVTVNTEKSYTEYKGKTC